jgi:sugar/nucleoside kinase (ribokinase family)
VNEPGSAARTLCLGEALIDLICERPIDELPDADAFVPHFGGVVANVAVLAARHGAATALAGGAGDDAWGRWLRARLQRERVDTSLFELVEGTPTALALVAIDSRGEPRYEICGESNATVVHALAGRVEEAVRESAAIFISSNTLVGTQEREVTMHAREAALELGRQLIFDPNLRLHRWPSDAEAAAAANACLPGALLVRTNEAEAALITGERDPERAARALVYAGARVPVVTRGAAGAIARGEVEADVGGAPAHVKSTVGAGDAMTGVLIARLAAAGFDPAAVEAALPEAVEESARACERWGALE